MKLSPFYARALEGAPQYARSLEGALRFDRLSLVLSLSLALSVWLAGATCSQRVLAQESPAAPAAEPTAYRDTIREALNEYRARNFPEARALFAEAHALYPNARTLRGLGMTAFELRSYRESIAYLTQALDSKEKPLDAPLRAETERLIARAERFVGKLNLTISPADAHITVDGNPISHAAGVALVLEVGEHSLEFSAEGYHTDTRSLYVKGKETETWSVVLPPLPPPAPVVAVPAPEEVARQAPPEEVQPGPRFVSLETSQRDDKKPLYKNPWLWTGVGAAVLTIIIVSVAVSASKTEVGSAKVGDNTPPGGKFSALLGAP